MLMEAIWILGSAIGYEVAKANAPVEGTVSSKIHQGLVEKELNHVPNETRDVLLRKKIETLGKKKKEEERTFKGWMEKHPELIRQISSEPGEFSIPVSQLEGWEEDFKKFAFSLSNIQEINEEIIDGEKNIILITI